MNTRALPAIILSVFLASCASTGRKPVSFIPQDTEEDFLNRYWFLVEDTNVEKEYKKLKTSEQRRAFIDRFWLERDPRKTTPENEDKIMYDKRIADVMNERLFTNPSFGGFRFDRNGGYRGDAAHVYLVLGPPRYVEKLTNGIYVTDLMLWVYLDGKDNVLYKFLFYEKNGMGYLVLFRDYFGDLASRLRLLSKTAIFYVDDSQVESIYEELKRMDPQGLFLWAIYEFSPLKYSPDQVLKSPPTAQSIYLASGARILGLPPKPSENLLRFGNNLSMVAGDVRMLPVDGKTRFFFFGRFSDLDWEIFKDRAESKFDLEIKLTNLDTGAKFLFESLVTVTPKSVEILNSNWEKVQAIPLPGARSGAKTYSHEILSLDELPAGRYYASIYIRSIYMNKFNQWEKNFTKE